jgi:hypothetical protein
VVARLAGPPLGRRLLEIGVPVVLVGFCVAWLWAFSPRAEKPIEAVATVRGFGLVDDGQALTQEVPTDLEVQLPDGRTTLIHPDARLVARCRKGAPIRVVGHPTHGGTIRWEPAPHPCG